MEENNKVWWEKTVEYSYVRKHLGDYEIIFPLDGNLEKLGDTMVGDSLRWIIIEFKACKSWEKPEKDKFEKYGVGRYRKAKLSLQKMFGIENSKGEALGIKHHFIVYGELNDVDDLYLKAERYFSEQNKLVFSPKNLLSDGIEESRFIEYIKKFNAWKSSSGDGGVSVDSGNPSDPRPDGGISLGEYGVVFGVSDKNNAIMCLTMYDFILQKSSKTTSNKGDGNNNVKGRKTSKAHNKKKKPSDPLQEEALV
ncbi:hypothetical protein [Vibrio parahaemolyticus]|uniref:hypothetical protein n=1 Tax=Vibrio parahaemolyticus TaxID=670 RepID=UPI001D951E81|nr:hypothetical protein [Vibrio parahaemolyticus]EHY0994017.1 hypothetical protein [Vibrio parahaemolyticus]MCR9669630.1 hypothetical protein [Vibrio parahaemolyticus]MCR9826112.1 hypothetical protein [Vibrio parahaemolyticus]